MGIEVLLPLEVDLWDRRDWFMLAFRVRFLGFKAAAAAVMAESPDTDR